MCDLEQGIAFDGLGCLVYAMTTGRWPALGIDSSLVHIPLAPAAGRTVPMPSRVRAGMPSEIDDLVTRSVRQVTRPRGSMPITSVNAFTSLAGSAEDYLSPVPGASPSSVGDRLRTAATAATTAITTTSTDSTEQNSDLPRRRVGFLRFTGRLIAVGFGVALTAGIAWFGWQQVVGEPVVEEQDVVAGESILETGAVPFEEEFDSGLIAVLPVEDVRSYDPLGDDNDDGQPDGVDGKERNKRAELAADADGTTAWLTRKYKSPTVGDKGGVGLIVNLGNPKQLSTIDLDLVGFGTDVDIRVADQILDDPDLWTDFASVNDAGPEITLRSPRSVTGQYVLIWFTGLPVIPESTTGESPRYQGGIRQVSITGLDPQEIIGGQ